MVSARLIKYTLILGLALAALGAVALSGVSWPLKASAKIPLQVIAYQTGFPVSAGDDVSSKTAPLVADVDNDGKQELFLPGRGRVYGWNYQGQPLPNFPLDTGDGKIVASLAAADLDGDGDLEILAGSSSEGQSHDRARVFAWHHTGAMVSGWPQSTQWNNTWAWSWSWNEVTSLAVADIDGDGDPEVLAVTTANTGDYSGSNPPHAFNAYAWHHTGAAVSGWPTSPGNWPTYDSRVAIYGLIAAGDFDGDTKANPILPRDYNILYAYDDQGHNLPNWPQLVFYPPNGDWGDNEIGMGLSAPVLADLNWDGVTELITVGILNTQAGQRINSAALVLEPDGSRYPGWNNPALGSGWNSAQNCTPIGVASVANLDTDPELEIIVSTNDGFVRVYEHDQTLRWQFDYRLGQNLIASEAVVGDVDGDNQVEIVFGTHQANYNSTSAARIWALEASDGAVVTGFPLTDIGDRNIGICAAPVLADVDDDGDVELIVNRKADAGQLAVWGLPGAYNSFKMPWPQSRHEAQHTATYKDPAPNLNLSRHFSTTGGADLNELASFSVFVRNNGGTALTTPLTITVQLPAGLTNPQNITLTPNLGGTVTPSADSFTWSGILDSQQQFTLTYQALVNTNQRLALTSQATLQHPLVDPLIRDALFIANPVRSYLPLILKN